MRLDVLPLAAAASVASYAVAVLVLRRSILTEKIARRGRHIGQEHCRGPSEPRARRRHHDAKPGYALRRHAGTRGRRLLAKAPHRACRVVDGEGRVLGLASRSDALRWSQTPPEADTTVGELVADHSLQRVLHSLPVDRAAKLMLVEEIARLPVVDDESRLIGLLARRDLLRARADYRCDERDRSRFTGMGRR